MDELTVKKICSLFLLLVLSLFVGLLPLKIRTWIRSFGENRCDHTISRIEDFVNLIMAFGGGVLISTCFLHMLPEVREQLSDWSSDYPISELITCVGFFLVYTLEEMMDCCVYLMCSRSKTFDLEKSSGSTIDGCSSRYGAIGNTSGDSQVGHNHCMIETYQHNHSTNSTSENDSSIGLKASRSTFRGLVIVVSLSLHSIIEGMAVGLQQNDTDVWTLLLAISIHKAVLISTIGTQLACTDLANKIIAAYVTVLSSMSPIGIATGIIISSWRNETVVPEGVVIGLCQGIATGTLLYVTFFEIMMNVRQSTTSGQLKLLSVVVGFVFMTWVTFDYHEHHSDHLYHSDHL